MPPALPALYLIAGVRALEAAALKTDPDARLMERAGLAAAERVRELAGGSGRSVLVLAGPGNNGGDAFEAAVHLKRWFYRVDVVFAGDAAKLPHDAGAAAAKWTAVDGRLLQAIPAAARYDLVFVCDTDIPYEESWDRSGEVCRAAFQRQVIGDLVARKTPYYLLRGSLEERAAKVRTMLGRFHKYMNVLELAESASHG